MGLLDGFLQKKKLPIANATTTIGRRGHVIYGGFLSSGDSDARLSGREKYVTYSDIVANTSIVAAGTRYFLNLVTKARWKVAPPDDSADAKMYADKVEAIMHDMQTPWHQIIRRAAMYRFYGFSIQEWTAKIRPDGDVGFLDVMPRPQSTIYQWWTNPTTGRVTSVTQYNVNELTYVQIPREKLVYLVDDTLSDTPEGLGIFRHIVEPAKRLQKYVQLEGFGFESDLHGTPIGRAPYALLDSMVNSGTITAEQKNSLVAPLEDFIQGHLKGPNLGLTLDSEMYRSIDEHATPSATPKFDIDVLRVGLGGSLQQVGHAIDRINHDMARVLGCEHLLMGGNDRGSYAMSKDKTANFYLMVDAAIQEINAVYQTDWLDVLWKLNGWPEDKKPEFLPETLKFSDVDQICAGLRDMAIAGGTIAPDDPAIDAVREIMGVPKTPDSYASIPVGGQHTTIREQGVIGADGQLVNPPAPGAAGGPNQGTPLPGKIRDTLRTIAALAVEAKDKEWL